MIRLFRLTAVVLLLSLAAASAAQASPGSSRPPIARQAPQPAGLFDAALRWLGARLEGVPRLLASWGEDGCGMDPDGRCVEGPSSAPVPPEGVDSCVPSGADAGCGMDPDGSN